MTWSDLRLDAAVPHVYLKAWTTKGGRHEPIPLHSDLVTELKTRKAAETPNETERVFGSVPDMDEHRDYLSKAGIPWKDAEGRRADVHSLRMTYGTLLFKTGASAIEVKELMRHTDMRLTTNIYTDRTLLPLAQAVNRLPIPPVPLTAPMVNPPPNALPS